MKRTGAQIVWETPGPRRGGSRLRLSRRGQPAHLRCHARLPHPPRARPPRAGRGAHGRWLRPRQRQGGRGHGHLRPRRHQPGDRHRHRHDGFLADRLHHRPGRQQVHRLRCLPGNRRDRHHPAHHQAQLPGHRRRRHRATRCARPSTSPAPAGPARCWWISPRMPSRPPSIGNTTTAPIQPARLPPRPAPAARAISSRPWR